MVISGGEAKATTLSPASGPDAVRAADSLLKAAGVRAGDVRSLGAMSVVEEGASCFVTGPIIDGYTGKTVATPKLPISCGDAKKLLDVQDGHKQRVAILMEHRQRVAEADRKIPREMIPATIKDVYEILKASNRYTAEGLDAALKDVLTKFATGQIPVADLCLNGIFRMFEEPLAFGKGGSDSFNMGIPGEAELENMFE